MLSSSSSSIHHHHKHWIINVHINMTLWQGGPALCKDWQRFRWNSSWAGTGSQFVTIIVLHVIIVIIVIIVIVTTAIMFIINLHQYSALASFSHLTQFWNFWRKSWFSIQRRLRSTFTHGIAIRRLGVRFIFISFQTIPGVNGPGVVKITRFILNPPLWWSLDGLQTMS